MIWGGVAKIENEFIYFRGNAFWKLFFFWGRALEFFFRFPPLPQIINGRPLRIIIHTLQTNVIVEIYWNLGHMHMEENVSSLFVKLDFSGEIHVANRFMYPEYSTDVFYSFLFYSGSDW